MAQAKEQDHEDLKHKHHAHEPATATEESSADHTRFKHGGSIPPISGDAESRSPSASDLAYGKPDGDNQIPYSRLTPKQQAWVGELFQHMTCLAGAWEGGFADHAASLSPENYFRDSTYAFFSMGSKDREWLRANDDMIYNFLIELYGPNVR